MKKYIVPRNYDYLWTDYEVDFIFTSCYLFKRFRQSDIVLIYDHRDRGLRFFLSKKERTKMGKVGLKFYSSLPLSWKKNMAAGIAEGRKLLKEGLEDKRRIKELALKDLGKKFLRRAQFFQFLANEYFFTEFFFLDLVNKEAKKKTAKAEIIRHNIAVVSRLKLEARAVLNNFYNYNKIFKIYINELNRRLKRDDLRWLGFVDIFNLSKGATVSRSELEKNDWVLNKRDNWKIVKGAEADALKKKFEVHFFHKNLKEFKGQAANHGRHVGIVKVVRTLFSNGAIKELSKVNKGDVLVAETTGPEMMVACRRAGAIVTDEGGVTSHAAIVSRELGIPCVIGTKLATKVLRDGDRVEVNADLGLVRLI